MEDIRNAVVVQACRANAIKRIRRGPLIRPRGPMSSSKRPELKHYYCHTWRENFYFMLGYSPEQANQYILKNHNHDIDFSKCDGKCVELVTDDGFSLQYIWIRKSNKNRMMAALAHECVHAAMHTLDRRGVNLPVDNHEPLAYLTEALVLAALK